MFNFSDDVFEHTSKLTPAVLQACEMLGMYQAELASVLGLQCADIGRMSSIKQFLLPDSMAWENAILFIRLFQCLYNKFNGNEAAMYHWLRADNKQLAGSPLLLIVDEGKLSLVLDFIINQKI